MAKRRPSGDGLVRKRADGRWEGRIVVGHKENGNPIYRSVFAEKQSDLMPRLNELKMQYAGVELTEESSITLGEWLGKWMEEYKKPILRPSTYSGYGKDILSLTCAVRMNSRQGIFPAPSTWRTRASARTSSPNCPIRTSSLWCIAVADGAVKKRPRSW